MGEGYRRNPRGGSGRRMMCGAQQLHERELVASLEAFRKCVATTMGSPEPQWWLRRALLWPSCAQCRQPPCGTRVEGKAWHPNVSLLCANVASPRIIQQPQSHSENSCTGLALGLPSGLAVFPLSLMKRFPR